MIRADTGKNSTSRLTGHDNGEENSSVSVVCDERCSHTARHDAESERRQQRSLIPAAVGFTRQLHQSESAYQKVQYMSSLTNVPPQLTRKQAAIVFIPVRSVTVALPPKINMVDTMMFVARPKHRNTRWASLPHLARMISRKLQRHD